MRGVVCIPKRWTWRGLQKPKSQVEATRQFDTPTSKLHWTNIYQQKGRRQRGKSGANVKKISRIREGGQSSGFLRPAKKMLVSHFLIQCPVRVIIPPATVTGFSVINS